MKIVFIDEVEQQQKHKSFFGLGAVIINSAFYKDFKVEFSKYFCELKWSEKEDFKGRYLFSKKGDQNVQIDKRINFVRNIAKLSKAKSNARYSYVFAFNYSGRSEDNYINLLTKLIKSLPSETDQKRDKPVVQIYYDSCEQFSVKRISEMVKKMLKPSLVLFERPLCINSDNLTPGLITVDTINYLKSWVVLSKNSDEAQCTLFENIGPRDQEKLKTISEIIAEIKNVSVIK